MVWNVLLRFSTCSIFHFYWWRVKISQLPTTTYTQDLIVIWSNKLHYTLPLWNTVSIFSCFQPWGPDGKYSLFLFLQVDWFAEESSLLCPTTTSTPSSLCPRLRPGSMEVSSTSQSEHITVVKVAIIKIFRITICERIMLEQSLIVTTLWRIITTSGLWSLTMIFSSFFYFSSCNSALIVLFLAAAGSCSQSRQTQ